MHSMKHMMKHPSQALSDVTDDLLAGGRKIAEKPISAGGILLLALGIIGFVWMLPELRRYLKIERM